MDPIKLEGEGTPHSPSWTAGRLTLLDTAASLARHPVRAYLEKAVTAAS